MEAVHSLCVVLGGGGGCERRRSKHCCSANHVVERCCMIANALYFIEMIGRHTYTHTERETLGAISCPPSIACWEDTETGLFRVFACGEVGLPSKGGPRPFCASRPTVFLFQFSSLPKKCLCLGTIGGTPGASRTHAGAVITLMQAERSTIGLVLRFSQFAAADPTNSSVPRSLPMIQWW